MRRPAFALAVIAVAVGLAGCGGGKTVTPTPQTVVGTIAVEAPGKGVYNANGCGACHTYKPAGSTQKIGPDLDNLAKYAKQAKQPLAAFIKTSIVQPNAYIQKGYPKNVMPNFSKLPASDVQALVAYLTTARTG